jgi:hypothetical protein
MIGRSRGPGGGLRLAAKRLRHVIRRKMATTKHVSATDRAVVERVSIGRN